MPHLDRVAPGHASHDLALLVACRIAHAQLQHEPVDLRLGQRVRALLLDRVLRREHEERLLELVGRATDGDLLLLHRLEERRLHLGGRAIDLVREDDIGEDRSLLDHELAGGLIVDLRPHDVRRQEVGGELDAREARGDRLGEGPHGERLRQPGHSLEQHVPPGEDADEQPVDHVLLTHDAQRDLAADVLNEAGIRGRRRRLSSHWFCVSG